MIVGFKLVRHCERSEAILMIIKIQLDCFVPHNDEYFNTELIQILK